ncbi:MAG: cation transporter [Chloroflexia bacterium]|nr:cation transporter [Chloroflexia bacterium]
MADDDATRHDHENAEGSVERVNRRPLAIALAITSVFLVAEVVGGLLTNSLALLADAGHMATDVAALALALFAIWLARRPATAERSFGFARAEVLAALVNAGSLIAISIYIFWEAFRRIGSPPEVDSGPMLEVAIAGLAANAASAWVLMRGGGHEENLNTRGAFLHVVGDMLGSAGAIAAALIMLATGWYLADPILSAGIGLLILWSSWRLLRESVEVLLESTPKGIDPVEVRGAMGAVAGVGGVHDVHIWTVTSGLVAMSGHVDITNEREWHGILDDLTTLLRTRFGIAHVTVQPEEMGAAPGGDGGCSLDTESGRNACRVALAAVLPGRGSGHRHRH